MLNKLIDSYYFINSKGDLYLVIHDDEDNPGHYLLIKVMKNGATKILGKNINYKMCEDIITKSGL